MTAISNLSTAPAPRESSRRGRRSPSTGPSRHWRADLFSHTSSFSHALADNSQTVQAVIDNLNTVLAMISKDAQRLNGRGKDRQDAWPISTTCLPRWILEPGGRPAHRRVESIEVRARGEGQIRCQRGTPSIRPT